MQQKHKTGSDLQSPVPPSFGQDVKRVREARGLTQKGLGRGAGFSEGHVSRVEAGLVPPSIRFAEGCDRTFGTGDLFVQQRRRLIEGEHPSWFGPYIDAERAATAIRDFSTMFIMGLLQTPDYARASLSAGRPYEPDDLDAQVTSRLRRREVLDRPTPPAVWVVLCEAALWNQVGSAQVMAEQMGHLLHMVRKYPTLTVQVLPYRQSATALATPYVLLETAGGKPFVYVEGPQGGRAYEASETVANTVRDYDQVRADSLGSYESVEYIETVRTEHERNARLAPVELQRQTRRQLRRVGPGTRVRRRRPRPRQ